MSNNEQNNQEYSIELSEEDLKDIAGGKRIVFEFGGKQPVGKIGTRPIKFFPFKK
ncbi:hypothetical protein [Nostoc sp. CMAA1605]|uniref:hypothetical protein n=1 Tax=Nostoc sp. CMAA1605 TaxID=2055159 RepID=UPI001F475D1B|nr:hypothetical protein [Nostoc sp. CMAA1605]